MEFTLSRCAFVALFMILLQHTFTFKLEEQQRDEINKRTHDRSSRDIYHGNSHYGGYNKGYSNQGCRCQPGPQGPPGPHGLVGVHGPMGYTGPTGPQGPVFLPDYYFVKLTTSLTDLLPFAANSEIPFESSAAAVVSRGDSIELTMGSFTLSPGNTYELLGSVTDILPAIAGEARLDFTWHDSSGILAAQSRGWFAKDANESPSTRDARAIIEVDTSTTVVMLKVTSTDNLSDFAVDTEVASALIKVI